MNLTCYQTSEGRQSPRHVHHGESLVLITEDRDEEGSWVKTGLVATRAAMVLVASSHVLQIIVLVKVI